MSNEMIIVWLTTLTVLVVFFYFIVKKAANENVDMADENNKYFVDRLIENGTDFKIIYSQLKEMESVINDLNDRIKDIEK